MGARGVRRGGGGKRRDGVENAVVAALRQLGCSVERLTGVGVPDLLVCRGGALVALAEVKSDSGKLTPAQVAWRAQHRGPAPVILRCVPDAIHLVQYGPAGLTT